MYILQTFEEKETHLFEHEIKFLCAYCVAFKYNHRKLLPLAFADNYEQGIISILRDKGLLKLTASKNQPDYIILNPFLMTAISRLLLERPEAEIEWNIRGLFTNSESGKFSRQEFLNSELWNNFEEVFPSCFYDEILNNSETTEGVRGYETKESFSHPVVEFLLKDNYKIYHY